MIIQMAIIVIIGVIAGSLAGFVDFIATELLEDLFPD